MPTNAVSLKLPEFWEQQAAVWFAQAKAQFTLREITADDTKYYYVVAALNSSTVARVISILENPPARDKYSTLKAYLLKTFCLSETERTHRSLSLPGLGDSRPSELMCTSVYVMSTSVYPVLRAAAQGSDERPAPAARQSAEQGLCFFHARFGAKAKKCHPPCTFNVSRNMQTLSSIVANDTAYLLFITDSLSGRHFLCDTGVQVSVLPASTVDRRLGKVGSPLEAANQCKIHYASMAIVLHRFSCAPMDCWLMSKTAAWSLRKVSMFYLVQGAPFPLPLCPAH